VGQLLVNAGCGSWCPTTGVAGRSRVIAARVSSTDFFGVAFATVAGVREAESPTTPSVSCTAFAGAGAGTG
jgi:hypothetical protein